MFYNSYKIMFFSILMTGTLITVSSNSWFGAWMGLEINLLSFIPLMTDNNNNLMATEASLKYFLTQALASSVLLLAVILLIMNNNLIMQVTNINNLMILSALLLKCGAAPFHFWFPNVMEGLNWLNGLILMTWQKIAPLMLISYTPLMNFIMGSTFLSLLIGSLGGLNQTSLRKLMAFSSINHLGWMLAAIYYSETLWMMYFLFYSFLSMSLILMWNFFKLYHINHLFSFSFNSKIYKMFMFLSLLSLGGLPPFMGFIPKWMVIQLMVMNNQLFLLTIMVILTLITLYFYLRLCYSAFMLNYFEPNWFNTVQFNTISVNIYFLLSFLSVFGLLLISLIYSFM